MTPTAVLKVQAERAQLAAIRAFTQNEVARLEMDPEDIDDLVQAVDEAATNIIVHGYKDGPGSIEIAIDSLPDAVVIYLRDRAISFDSTTVPEPDIHIPLEQRPVGGMGIYLIRRCVDEFRHDSLAGGGNEITLIKHKKAKGDD